VGAPKAAIAERLLAELVAAKGYHETLEAFTQRLGY
jgi:hypothetical protein